ncbi:hypothetical protein ACFX15_037098 [Malus domestica]
MEEALELARAKDTKERMAGVERLHQLLEASRKNLSSSEVTSLVDCCLDLLKDNNFRVSQGALQALASAAMLSSDHLKLYFNETFQLSRNFPKYRDSFGNIAILSILLKYRFKWQKWQEKAIWSILEQFWAWNGQHMNRARWMDVFEDQKRLGIVGNMP